ncbi:MAG: hypothetical protein KIT56_04220, partial [Gammaproteobacteria bacterium]|nr:hypothetical protein [Gammaproteobacteria bacterium]
MTNSHHAQYYIYFQQINTETTVLTPNRRLSAIFHKLYRQYQLEQQHELWETPTILPVSSWIHQLWSDHADNTFSSLFLLNSVQEHYLWEKILTHEKSNEQLLQISETAELAKSAWNLLRQWQVDINHPCFNASDDYSALRKWAIAFQQDCEKHCWIDSATLPNMLIEKIKAGSVTPPQHIMMVGFTECSPQFSQLLKTCELAGSKISYVDVPSTMIEHKRISLADHENEIQTMARWARLTLKNHPTATIGCVIPALEKMRDRVAQLFSEVFAEESTYTIDLQNSPFNISAGKSLIQYPIIHAALQLLSLHKKNISSATLSFILSTPFIGEAEVERIKRANFDRLLRENNKNNIDLSASLNEDKSNITLSLKKHCPFLARRIEKFLLLVNNIQKKLSYSEWATHFNNMLIALGWPGERSLNSEEYQIVDCWLNLLNEYKTLDYVAKPTHFSQALYLLQKTLGSSVFQ